MKRERLARFLKSSGLLEPILRVRHRVRLPLLTVLTYHRIGPFDAVGDLDPDTLDAAPETFRRQLDFIQKYFTVLCARDLLRTPPQKFPPNPLILTFDDGYRDNHDVALPILQARGLKATFFIATSYPGAGKLFWWDRIALVLARTKRETIELRGPSQETVVVKPAADRRGARAAILRFLKRTPGIEPDSFSLELVRSADVDIGDEEQLLAERTIMSWEHIGNLASAGMDVQSHSHSHRVLSTMKDDEIEHDLKLSRELLFRKINSWPCALAYPTGRCPSSRERTIASAAGFRLAFTNQTGVSDRWRYDPYEISRMAMGHESSLDFFCASLAVPYLSHRHRVNAA